MDLVVTSVSGGLGNQLFQYIAGETLSRRWNVPHFVDASSFNSYSYHHDFELLRLFPDINLGSHALLSSAKSSATVDENSIRPYLGRVDFPTFCEVFHLRGYFQDEKYLSSQIVSEAYSRLGDLVADVAEFDRYLPFVSQGFAAVHIRRRDYAHMGLCSEEYYIACLSHIKALDPAINILVFSDEPNYSRSFLLPYFGGRLHIVSTGSDFADLYLMSKAKYIVISNSTYSWWAAKFDEQMKSLVFVPNPWVLPDPTVNPCPERWRSIRGSIKETKINTSLLSGFVAQIHDFTSPQRSFTDLFALVALFVRVMDLGLRITASRLVFLFKNLYRYLRKIRYQLLP